ncbi:hypothetical protein SBA1_750017 [Candidatus Sulfotelmatobacter kueseliae]|uniref:Uncharacterized protein n=1 Tax=Candidatus Sulfotelmatobacter kueseliae TaxID=2042962 RepID=A0A2U3L6Q2_9BACT|nr:hypothetical protein SBA1_750017 [Candidatus Sulfotelmatobacter kueseliae]
MAASGPSQHSDKWGGTEMTYIRAPPHDSPILGLKSRISYISTHFSLDKQLAIAVYSNHDERDKSR